MKKLLGLIAVVAVVFTLTMTVNMSNDQTEGTSEMIAYNIAEAQIIDPVWGCRFTGSYFDRCTVPGMTVINCVNGIPTSCGVIRPKLETLE